MATIISETNLDCYWTLVLFSTCLTRATPLTGGDHSHCQNTTSPWRPATRHPQRRGKPLQKTYLLSDVQARRPLLVSVLAKIISESDGSGGIAVLANSEAPREAARYREARGLAHIQFVCRLERTARLQYSDENKMFDPPAPIHDEQSRSVSL